MLTGTKVKLQVFAPTIGDLLTRPVSATVSDKAIEFNDVSFTALNGTPYTVVPAQFDIKGSHVGYKIIADAGSAFAGGDFNGYAMSFAALGGKADISLRAADIVGKETSLDIDKSDVFVSKTTLYINVSSLSYVPHDRIGIELGFNIDGGAGRDNLSGMAGRDALNGLGGNDKLAGGAGKDVLTGGRGADILTGGAGADVFCFNAVAESIGKASGRDTITDFSHKQHDRIDLSHIDLGHGRASEHFAFIGSGHFSGEGAPELRVQHQSGGVYVAQGDVDGDGQSDIVVQVHSPATLQQGDFVL